MIGCKRSFHVRAQVFFRLGFVATQIKVLLWPAAFVLASVFPLAAQDISSSVDDFMNAQMQASLFSGSILIARSDKVLVRKGYGMANAELDVPNSSETNFRIGPISQQFTAMAILQLQEKGKLDVQDTICKYIPECPNKWREIKIINLLVHTSGIPELTDSAEFQRTMASAMTVPEYLRRLKKEPLEFTPGDKFHLSDSGYVVLGATIETVSGTSYAKYLQEHIFNPLGMSDTGYDSPRGIIPHRASGYRRNGGTLVNSPYPDMSISYSARGLYSTVEDLYRWDRALDSEKLVSRRSLEQMFTPYRDGSGFGWMILKEFGRKALTRGGRVNGFSASIRRYPDDHACVIVLSNLESSDAERISHDLATILWASTMTSRRNVALSK
jgi:CubicO group peptidase (beta-lactamase class C family)